jgi:PAS domain S-box-containing protein
MIWDSLPLMTAIDLLIIAATVYGIWRCRLISRGQRFGRARMGLLLINLGLLAVALFYAADLAIMHVLPMLTGMDEAMEVMKVFHRNLSWLVILFAVISISIGFIELLVELQRRETRVRRLIDANIIGILIYDLEGAIIEANDAFLRMVGYSRADLVSGRMRWTDLTPPEWRDSDRQAVQEVKMTGTAQPWEKEYFRKDGSRAPVLIGAASFEGAGNQGVAFVLDQTRRKQMEAVARESERRYREVQMQLAHANRVDTMGQLTASIAHEVNQPIATMVVNAQVALRYLAQKPPDVEETRHLLDRIVTDGRRASNVVGRIRDLIKRAPPRTERVEINDAIGEVIELTRGEAMKNSISVETHFAEGMPAVEADRTQLQQVLLNLIVNAVHALSEGGQEPRELSISTSMDGSTGVLVSVRDSGPGICPEDLGRLFDPFYTTRPGGMGMGLSICRSIVEAHGGRLWATPNLAHGATFQFTLPVHAEAFTELRA